MFVQDLRNRMQVLFAIHIRNKKIYIVELNNIHRVILLYEYNNVGPNITIFITSIIQLIFTVSS